MIDGQAAQGMYGQVTITRPQKVLRMVQNERMAGSVPVWENPESPRQKAEERLSFALSGETQRTAAAPENALAYNQPPEADESRPQPQEFGFSDLVDMVNPLHHIPVVGHVYRGITGDGIKPVARIIGGTVFGGPIGAAGSLVNVIVEEETGKDLAGNAFAMAFRGETPSFRSRPVDDLEHPQARLSRVAGRLESRVPLQDLPGALLAFADLGQGGAYAAARLNGPDDAAGPPGSGFAPLRKKQFYDTTSVPSATRSASVPLKPPMTVTTRWASSPWPSKLT